MNLTRRHLSLGLPLAMAVPAAALGHEGHDQTPFSALPVPLPTESPGKIEVLEFFWYGCPHCASLEPHLQAWKRRLPADVVLRPEHVVWDGRPETMVHARLFATLQALDLLDAHQLAVFDAVHKERINFRSDPALAGWLQGRGIDRAAFEAMYKSFGMTGRLSRLRNLTNTYQIRGVPVFFINGRYTTEPHRAGGEQQVLAVMDRLVAEERKRLAR